MIEITQEGPVKKESAIDIVDYKTYGCPVCGYKSGWSMIQLKGAIDRKCSNCHIRFWIVDLNICNPNKWIIKLHPLSLKNPQPPKEVIKKNPGND